MPRAALAWGLLALGVLPIPSGARAQAPDATTIEGLPPPDFAAEATLAANLALLDRTATTIIAEIGSRSVTRGDVADAIRSLPSIVSAVPFQQLVQNAIVQVAQVRALAAAAEAAGLDKSLVMQRRMRNAGDEALANEMLRRSLAPNLTEGSLRAVYDGVVAGKPGPDQVRARIIMVDERAEADSLIHRLQNGADFAELARDHSKDGTAAVGGDLGYARLDMLAPELGSVIFALAPGQITAFPVRSGNRWFIIKVEGRRQVQAPSFEDARLALERDVTQAGIIELRRKALQAARVTYYGFTGKAAPAQPAK